MIGELLTKRGILFIFISGYCLYKTFNRPVFGVAFFISLLILRDPYIRVQFPVVFEGLHMPQLTAVLILLVLFKKGNKYFTGSFLLLFAYLAAAYASRLVNGYPMSGESADELFKSIILVIMVLFSIKTDDDLKLLIKTIIFVVFFLFLNVYSDYKFYGYDLKGIGRYYYMNRNSLGYIFAIVAPLSIVFYFINTIKWKRLMFLGIPACLAVGVIITYSRASALSLATGMFVIFFVNKSTRKVLAVSGIVMLLMVLPRISESYFGRMETIGDYKEEGSAMGRVATNMAALKMIKEKPLLGFGAGNYPDYSLEYTPDNLLMFVREGKQIHNIMLQAFSETGFLGGIPFTLFIVVNLFKGFRARFRSKMDSNQILMHDSLLACVVAYIIAAQFGQGAYYGWLWVFMPILMASTRILENFSKNNINPEQGENNE